MVPLFRTDTPILCTEVRHHSISRLSPIALRTLAATKMQQCMTPTTWADTCRLQACPSLAAEIPWSLWTSKLSARVADLDATLSPPGVGDLDPAPSPSPAFGDDATMAISRPVMGSWRRCRAERCMLHKKAGIPPPHANKIKDPAEESASSLPVGLAPWSSSCPEPR